MTDKPFKQKRTQVLGVLYLSMVAAALTLTIVFDGDVLSFFYLTLTLAGIYLNSVRVKEGLLLFTLSSAFYAYLSFSNKFYGEFALYIAITVYYAVFYFKWKRSPADTAIKSFAPRVWLILLAIGTAFVPLYALLLNRLNASQPVINSILTLLTCTAVIITAARTWQQFIIWAAINVAQSVLWFTTLSAQDLSYLSLIIVNIFLLFINIYNLLVWHSAYKRQNSNNTAYAADKQSSFNNM